MDWFKHDTSSIDDPDIQEAELIFGDAGYAVFFKVCEIYGKEYSHLIDGELTIDRTILRRKLHKSWTTVEQILSFYRTKNRIFFTTNGTHISYRIPKYLKMASNWTKREDRKKQTAPTEAPTEAPTAIEVEVDKEERPKEEQTPPSKEEINESSIPKIEADLDKVCQELYDKRIFDKAFAFRNTKAKAGKNKRAILHSLCRALLKKTFDGNPWEYCERIMQVEDGNFNERDYRKTA